MEGKASDEESDFIGFSPIKDKSSSESDIEKANSLAKQLHVYKPGIEFVPGSKLEVLDSRDNKWYLCKVVEVDWGELDILVHYERWSVRFDEWLKMDSTRIRPLCIKKENKKAFKIGEKVLGFWAPNCKMYPAQIIKQISDDFWNVLFFDGISKSLRTSQIKKAHKKFPSSNVDKSSKSVTSPLLEESKQGTSSGIQDTPSKAEEVTSGSPSALDGNKRNIFNVEILKEKRKTIRKPDVEELFQSLKKRKRSEVLSDGEDDVQLKENHPKRKYLKGVEEKETTKELHRKSDDLAELKTEDETSYVIEDKNPPVKKPFDADAPSKVPIFDFNVVKIEESEDENKDGLIVGSKPNEDIKKEGSHVIATDDSQQKHKSTKHPKERQLILETLDPFSNNSKMPVTVQPSATTPISKTKTNVKKETLRQLSTTENSHLCPKKGCEKSFRKESLLQMHMKHYHPLLFKRKSLQAPNVADLAYARTVGDHLDAELGGASSSSAFSLSSYSHEKPHKQTEKKLSKSFLGFKSKSYSLDSQREESLDLSISDIDDDSSHSNFSEEFDINEVEDDDDDIDEFTEEYKPVPDENDPDYCPVSVQKEKPPTKTEDKAKQKFIKSEEGEDELQRDSWAEPDEANNTDGAIINCKCESQEEDGLMLQCDVCQCWQHGSCYSIENESQVPDRYICSLCENPNGLRSSMRFKHHQEWLKEGKIPRFSFCETECDPKLEASIRKGHELSANILHLSQLIHSLRLKIRISRNEDHPKFVMWFKKWSNIKDELDKGPIDEKSVVPSIMDALQEGSNSLMPLNEDAFCQQQQTASPSIPLNKDDLPLRNIDLPLETSTPTDSISVPNDIVQQDSEENVSQNVGVSSCASEEEKPTGESDPLILPNADSPSLDKDQMEIKNELPVSFGADQFQSIDNKCQSDPTKVALEDSPIDLELGDFLPSQSELEQFVDHAGSSLPPLPTPEVPSCAIPIIPETERIEPLKCKVNLLKHVENVQDIVFNRFDYIENQIQALETQMGLRSQFSKEEEELFSSQTTDFRDAVTIQARSLVKLLIDDLNSVNRMTKYKSN